MGFIPCNSWDRFIDFSQFLIITVRLLFCKSCCSTRKDSQKLDQRERHLREAKAAKIACPVLALLYNQGILHPNTDGRVSWDDLFVALEEIGTLPGYALFHSAGIAAFKDVDFHQSIRSRFGQKRYLNVFKMSVGQIERLEYIKHGCSSTIRDTRYDPVSSSGATASAKGDPATTNTIETKSVTGTTDTIDGIANDARRLNKSRRQRFERWFTRRVFFLKEDRCYLSGLARVIKAVRDSGETLGEWSEEKMIIFHPKCYDSKYKQELIEWQACLKLTSLFVCFGQVDEGSGRLYMSRADLESIYLFSKFPIGYKKRSWGFEATLRALSKMSEFDLKFAKAVEIEIINKITAKRRRRQNQEVLDTRFSDLKMMWTFLNMMKKRGCAFLDENEEDQLALDGINGHSSQRRINDGLDIERGYSDGIVNDINIGLDNGADDLNALSADDGNDDGSRLSLVSLDSNDDDDTIPLI